MELWYIRNQSLWLDFKLILLTIWAVIAPTGRLHFKLLKGLPEPPETLRGFV